jgi:type VI secretion system secreted protein Hcp
MMKDIYLKFSNGITAESADKLHPDWLEIISWSHVINQPKSATAYTAGGHTSERANHAPMIFFKEIDKSSPLIYQHCSGGTTFDEVVVDFMRADGEGNRVKYLRLKLKHVLIGSVSLLVSKRGSMIESFALKYAAVEWVYTQQKIGGGQGGQVAGAWSLTKNDKSYLA